MRYDDKIKAVDTVKAESNCEFSDLHPTEQAEAYREVEDWAGKKAVECETRNERDGVPELNHDD